MKKLLYLLLILPIAVQAAEVTTTNQLPQQFFSANQPHNEWTCTDPTHNHGNNIGAMVNGDFLMHPGVSLADDVNMTEAQIQNGWESVLGADIWHWNTSTSTTTMTQTITDSAGNVTTQTRDIVLNSCGRINCGGYNTYTDTHVQGANTATDFQIAVKFNFAESTNRTSHWAVDIKNPTLKITYEDSPQPQISQETLTQLENVDTQIENAIDMLENEEIGGTTFTEMVEDILIDSGLDMELTMGFVEPEMNLEEQMYIGETVEVDSVEQAIDDEMAGVMILAPTDMDLDEPEMDTPTIDVMPDMDMPEPSFTEMASDTFTSAIDTISEMFGMDMPEDISDEAVTEIMDAMVEMDMPEGAPDVIEVYEAPDTVASLDESTNVETLDESPVEMERPEAMEEEVVQSEEPVAMGEDDTMTSTEPTMEANQPTEEVQSSENETVTTETTTETPQEENTSATSQPETETQSNEAGQEGDSNQETETVSNESSMDENTPSENTPTQEGGQESITTEADTEVSTSTTNVRVDNIGEKVAKIIAKVNQNLKRVSDRVRAVQLITLKGIQTDGPNLNNYASKSFYKDLNLNGVPNPDFFQNINIIEQQQIYADAKLAYRDNDPIAVKQSMLIDINNKKNKLYRELRDLKR